MIFTPHLAGPAKLTFVSLARVEETRLRVIGEIRMSVALARRCRSIVLMCAFGCYGSTMLRLRTVGQRCVLVILWLLLWWRVHAFIDWLLKPRGKGRERQQRTGLNRES